MGYRNLDIQRSYETQRDRSHLLDSFYIPMLEQTKQYFRIAGFFSSSALTVAAEGIEGLIRNGGYMRLLISPRLSEQDIRVITENQSSEVPETLSIFKEIDLDEFKQLDHLQALAWLLANKKLEIRIVVDRNSQESLFHQKIGIGYDAEGDMISFSGSINESAQAWLGNIEEFKTFKSWELGQCDYLLDDLKKFNEFWNGERKDIAAVYTLPESIACRIIEAAPRDVSDLAVMKKYKDSKREKSTEISLFSHQRNAVAAWLENNCMLLIEMATGTGKTRTAIGCMLTLLPKTEGFLVVIATPQNTLSRQWQADIDSLGIVTEYSKIIDGSNPKWKKDLVSCLLDLSLGMLRNAIIYTTHRTASSKDFIKLIHENKESLKIMFICDEVHAIGADHQQQALLDIYQYRVGLSATPTRMFDEEGTDLIRSYFGSKSFTFSIKDALGTINPLTGKPFLNPFFYHPVFVDLTDAEHEEYMKLSKKIAVASSSETPNDEQLEMLRIQRAAILKNAELKAPAVEQIVLRINDEERIKDTLIFAAEKQVDDVLRMLISHGITRCKITEEESYADREALIEQFRDGGIQVLVGIKCLDEGIDIPTARIAILMASSTNPREYVQRIGRVIRPAHGKTYSHIYDLIVNPSGGGDADLKVLQREFKRAMQIADNAMNRAEVIEIFRRNGVEEDADQ